MRLLSFLLLAALAPAAAAQSISVTPEKPIAGQEATIRFDAPVDTLVITFRPNSAIATADVVPIGGRDEVRWTFAQAGVVRLAVPGGPSQNVSVRFSQPPASGLFVLALAGLILFGGAAFAMTKLLRGGPPRPIPHGDT